MRLPPQNKTRTFQVQDANHLYLTAAHGGPGVNIQAMDGWWTDAKRAVGLAARVTRRVTTRALKPVLRAGVGRGRVTTPQDKIRARTADVERRIGELKALAARAGLLRASTDPKAIMKAVIEIRSARNRHRARTGISAGEKDRLNQEARRVDEALKVAEDHAQQIAASMQASIQLENQARLAAMQGTSGGGLPTWVPIVGVVAAGAGALMLLKG